MITGSYKHFVCDTIAERDSLLDSPFVPLSKREGIQVYVRYPEFSDDSNGIIDGSDEIPEFDGKLYECVDGEFREIGNKYRQIPSEFAANEISRTHSNELYEDVDDTLVEVTNVVECFLWCILSFELEEAGGGSSPTGDIKLVISNLGTGEIEDEGTSIYFDLGQNSNKIGSTQVRVGPLAPGTYTAKAQIRKLSGTSDLSVDKTKIMFMALHN